METTFQEDIYYGDGEVWVTSKRVVANERDYWLNRTKLASVDVVRLTTRIWLLFPMLIISGITFLLMDANQDTPPYEPFWTLRNFNDFVTWLWLLVLAVLLVVLPILLRRIPKGEIYAVSLYRGHGGRGRLGKRPIIASANRLYIQQIVDAIQLALASKGHSYKDQESGGGSPSKMLEPRTARVYISIVEDSITAGDKTYPLSRIRSARLGGGSFSPFSWVTYLIILMPFTQQLFYYLTKGTTHSPSYETVSFTVYLALAVGYIAIFIALAVTMDQTAYTVIIRGTFGAEIIYASMNKAQAERVRDDIKQAIRNKGIAQPQLQV